MRQFQLPDAILQRQACEAKFCYFKLYHISFFIKVELLSLEVSLSLPKTTGAGFFEISLHLFPSVSLSHNKKIAIILIKC